MTTRANGIRKVHRIVGDLKKLYGDRYRIILDEAASPESLDPWMYQIACKYGHIYPHSGTLLGFFCDSVSTMHRLHREHPELAWTECDGKAKFYFMPSQFKIVAEYAKPRREPGQRQLSLERKARQVERLRK